MNGRKAGSLRSIRKLQEQDAILTMGCQWQHAIGIPFFYFSVWLRLDGSCQPSIA